MKERPILFSGAMVRALLAGTKTQTRRPVKPVPEEDQRLLIVTGPTGFQYVMDSAPMRPYPEARRIRWDFPYGQPGDRLWVRESHAPRVDCLGAWQRSVQEGFNRMGVGEVCFKATTTPRDWVDKWRPSIHMHRWASRITLEITSVRVERLQDISEADAIAEGVFQKVGDSRFGNMVETATGGQLIYADPRQAREEYRRLWEQINGAGSWEANPWVWVVEFQRAKP